jgi:hypothetical protein
MTRPVIRRKTLRQEIVFWTLKLENMSLGSKSDDKFLKKEMRFLDVKNIETNVANKRASVNKSFIRLLVGLYEKRLMLPRLSPRGTKTNLDTTMNR